MDRSHNREDQTPKKKIPNIILTPSFHYNNQCIKKKTNVDDDEKKPPKPKNPHMDIQYSNRRKKPTYQSTKN